MATAQAELLDLLKRVVGNAALASGRAVEGCVVHQDELAVGSAADVYLHHVYTHAYGVLNALDGILGRATPIGTVGDDEHIIGFWIVKAVEQRVDMGGCLGGEGREQQGGTQQGLLD